MTLGGFDFAFEFINRILLYLHDTLFVNPGSKHHDKLAILQ